MDELLYILKKNALETPANMAKLLDQSEEQVREKIAEYEESGIIKGYQAVVNRDKLDLQTVSAVIEVRITPEREGGFNRIAERISGFQEVESLYLMSGSYDLLVIISGDTLNEVASFVSDKLATIEGVLSTSTHFRLKTFKEQGVLMGATEEHERLKVTP
jgi:DNA-binding Lrp family transcriptional regulator